MTESMLEAEVEKVYEVLEGSSPVGSDWEALLRVEDADHTTEPAEVLVQDVGLQDARLIEHALDLAKATRVSLLSNDEQMIVVAAQLAGERGVDLAALFTPRFLTRVHQCGALPTHVVQACLNAEYEHVSEREMPEGLRAKKLARLQSVASELNLPVLEESPGSDIDDSDVWDYFLSQGE